MYTQPTITTLTHFFCMCLFDLCIFRYLYVPNMYVKLVAVAAEVVRG